MATSVVFARALLLQLAARHIAHDDLIARCNLDADRLADLRETMSVEEFDTLARETMQRTDEPALGLLVGARSPLSMLQLVGQLIFAQRTLRDAFAALRRYWPLLSESQRWTLEETADVAQLTCDTELRLGDSTRFEVDCALALLARIVRHFLPEHTDAYEVRLQHEAPEYAARYTELLGCPVSFAQPDTALLMPVAYLDVAQGHADEFMSSMLRDVADQLLAERTDSLSFLQRVRIQLRYEADLTGLQSEQLARRFGLSSRSLRRKLNAEGTSLSGLLDEARRNVACELLRTRKCSVKHAAQRVGFEDPSAFYRAFRRWTGLTPLQYAESQAPDAMLGAAQQGAALDS